jgi:GntR family transcriptional regulator
MRNPAPTSPTAAPAFTGRQGSRYSAVAMALITDIQSGRYAIGDTLPSEATLQQMFAVSRQTVRQALRHLNEQGFTSTQQGIGTTVRAQRTTFRFVHTGATMDDLVQFSKATRTRLIGQRHFIADEMAAQSLRCPPGQAWLELSLLRYAASGTDPIGHLWVYLRPEFASIVPEIESSRHPHFSLIERTFGIRLVEMEQDIASVLLPEDICERLNTPAGSHGLQITRRFVDQQHRLTQVSVGIYPSDRLVHTTRVRIGRDSGQEP